MSEACRLGDSEGPVLGKGLQALKGPNWVFSSLGKTSSSPCWAKPHCKFKATQDVRSA